MSLFLVPCIRRCRRLCCCHCSFFLVIMSICFFFHSVSLPFRFLFVCPSVHLSAVMSLIVTVVIVVVIDVLIVVSVCKCYCQFESVHFVLVCFARSCCGSCSCCLTSICDHLGGRHGSCQNARRNRGTLGGSGILFVQY